MRQRWEDYAFFQVAAMRIAGISATEASEHTARWRDEFSIGESTVKASTIEKGYTAWVSDPLRGKVWWTQLSREMEGLTAKEKISLIQANKLRAEMLPPSPKGLKGVRR
ncbi:hypothetical protein [Celeribacter sp. PS-C1]|uniref:hypothetical protein n=1 Tax=Celeribacter sp. PS-C1 TaxID=2820813 RepID=UPI001CA55DD9|nr:hypothetical protein [Celeribacter sp. PS-C1]MBW6419569.1 hypothetical protein [Celeribacter sp. PS-C1]